MSQELKKLRKQLSAIEKQIAGLQRDNAIGSALRILPQAWALKEKIKKLEAES
jgi:hypothetical protein